MNPVSNIGFSSAPVFMRDTHPLRRQLRAEFSAIREQIAHSRLQDEMTQSICIWLDNFTRALNSSQDEEGVLQAYIPFLQDLLVDPITSAPLDPHALLGSDGHTYGMMSLAVFRLTAPQQFRTRSPLDLQNEQPLIAEPHTVVRHMIGWLHDHKALLYSEEVRQKYVALLSQRPSAPKPPSERRAKMEAILKRRAEAREAQEEEKKEAASARILPFLGRATELNRELRDRAAESSAQIAQSHQRNLASFEELEARDRAREEELRGRIIVVEERLEAVQEQVVQAQAPYAEVQNLIANDSLESRAAFVEMSRQIAQAVEQALNPPDLQSDAHVRQVMAQVEEESRRQQEALAQLERQFLQTSAGIAVIQEQIQELNRSLAVTTVALTAARRQELILQRSIAETRLQVEQAKQKRQKSIWSTIAIIGVSVFATWALGALMPAAPSLQGAFLPQQRGGLQLALRFIF